MDILLPIIAIGGMGLIFGALLSIAAKIFAVEKDERIPRIVDVLPGANCGGCGFAGCSAYAEAVCKGEAGVSGCPVGGHDVAEKIAAIMGVEAQKEEKMVSFVACSGNCEVAPNKFLNNETIDCHTANRLSGGIKGCTFGCLGFGSCVSKCQFDAISIQNGIAVVDHEKCTNCGACIAECPRGVITRVPYRSKAVVVCSSKAPGKETRQVCNVGCIGCGICAKNCESEAITVENNLARINGTKCTGCGVCVEKCPRKIIKLIKTNDGVEVALIAEKV